MFLIDLVALFLCSVQISAYPQFLSEDFVFPLEKTDDFMSCTFKNGTIGECVNLSECSNARDEYQSGINPTICHFVKEEPVVCCIKEIVNLPISDPLNESTTEKDNRASDVLVKRRKSVAQCEDVYSMAVPFNRVPGEFHISVVGGSVTSEGEFPHMVTYRKSNIVRGF